MAQPRQQREATQLEPSRQVVQTGRSDYSRESHQERRQMGKSIAQVNTEVLRDAHFAEERLINYPFAPQLQQRVLKGISSSGRKSIKSRYSRNEVPQPQSLQETIGQQPSRRLTPECEIKLRRGNLTKQKGMI